MISRDSPLRHLPVGLNPVQSLFLDGARHAGEMADLAYSRLKNTLTQIATADSETDDTLLYTAAFLDAWALVDVYDRFRALWAAMPNLVTAHPPPGMKTFAEIAQPVRNLRNVADHLAQRAQYVVARQGSALGELSWVTMTDVTRLEGVTCILLPGTLRGTKRRDHKLVNVAGQETELPTGLIHLAAGEHRANLSEVYPAMALRVGELENSVSNHLSQMPIDVVSQAGTDLLIRLSFKMDAEPDIVNGSNQPVVGR